LGEGVQGLLRRAVLIGSSPSASRASRPSGAERASAMIADRCASVIRRLRPPAGGELLDWQKEYNRELNKIHCVIEQVIAHFKTWRIMDTDYRRPIETFPETISTVIELHFYRMAE
jgi:hypothetical protein